MKEEKKGLLIPILNNNKTNEKECFLPITGGLSEFIVCPICLPNNEVWYKTTPILVFSHTSDDSTYISTVSSVTLKKPSKQLLQILKEQDFVFSEQNAEISEENSNWKIKDSEKTLVIKEKGNFLDLHNSNNRNSFKPVKIQGFAGYLNDRRFQSVDLYQEGIEGILYNDGNTILYFRPNGDGEFAQAKLLERFPSLLRKTTYSYQFLKINRRIKKNF